jgi:AraC family transcriptional regulator
MAAHLLRRHAARPAEPVVPARAPVVDIGLWRARDYIEQHLEGDLGLDVLAREAGISPALFTQRFTEAHGDTPHRYVVRRRLERARGLLAGSDLPIAEVALRAGFSSQSHLSEVFRRSTGETPGAFRRAARSAVAVPVGASWPRAEPGGSRMAGA